MVTVIRMMMRTKTMGAKLLTMMSTVASLKVMVLPISGGADSDAHVQPQTISVRVL